MNTRDGKGFKPSSEKDLNDPYLIFLNKWPTVRPTKGKSFTAKLISVTPNEFAFQGEHGMISVYRRDAIRSMILDEDGRRY